MKEPTNPSAISSIRVAAAALVTTTGFTVDISAYVGMTVRRSFAMRQSARPAACEPVNARAATRSSSDEGDASVVTDHHLQAAFGSPSVEQSRPRDFCQPVAQQRMRRVRLGDHWTPGRESGPEVVPEHAEGKGEVACAEDGDRAERLVDPRQAGCGAGRTVDRGSEVGALGGHVAVEAQLTGRARYLGGEARVPSAVSTSASSTSSAVFATRAAATACSQPRRCRGLAAATAELALDARSTAARTSSGDISSTVPFALTRPRVV